MQWISLSSFNLLDHILGGTFPFLCVPLNTHLLTRFSFCTSAGSWVFIIWLCRGLEALVLGTAFFLLCMPFYTWERWLHFDQWKTPVTLYNFTVMGDKVLQHYHWEKRRFRITRRYAYIYCPWAGYGNTLSQFVVYPFESTIQFSIRVGGKNSWTKGTRLSTKFNIKGESLWINRNTADGVTRGKLLGPDGKPFLCCMAPVQPQPGIGEYEEWFVQAA